MFLPQEVKLVIDKLQEKGHQAYVVGGCPRDILMDKKPKDWDIATSATPEEIGEIFLKSYTQGSFGTVTVLTGAKNETLKEIEVTTYRTEEKYTDKRHPEKVEWVNSIHKDLSRRDFTINAMAMDKKGNLIDPFDGKKDLENHTIKTVGDPEERFSEDALRMIRAPRFTTYLGPPIWSIEEKTREAIKKNAHLLKQISKERIRDELTKIIDSKQGARGIELLRRLNLLQYIIPELEEGVGVWQNKHHIYQIYQHNLLSLNYACHQNYSTDVKLASLLHDVGKPQTKEGEGKDATFYNHEVVGAKMTRKIMRRLRFSNDTTAQVSKLVRYHLFYYNVEEVSKSSVRRLVRKVGQRDMDKLLQVRKADRIGSGVPKAEPYKLRHMKYVIDKVSQDPISPQMLKVGGHDIMRKLKIDPSPKIGRILTCLLAQVLEDPQKNNRTFLEKEIVRLGKEVSEQEFNKTYKESKKYIDEIKEKRDKMTKKKYWVS